MNLRITGKQMDIGDAFRTRIEERVAEVVAKYFDGGFGGSVTVAKSGSRFTADCMIHLDSGVALQATSTAQEPVVSFDGAADKLETRLRRYKRRLRSRSTGASSAPQIDIAYSVMEGLAEDDEVELPDDYAPAIVAETTMALKTMSVASAVVQLDTHESPVVVFRNAGNDQVNIVYRRADGNIGWIDPSTTRTAQS